MSKNVKEKNGYAVNVKCDKGHSGNRGYALSQRGWYQCQGCGDFLSTASIIASQAAQKEAA